MRKTTTGANMTFDITKLSCIVGELEKAHPKTYNYYSDDDITVAGYFPANAPFNPGDKIIVVSITQTADTMKRTEKSFVVDMIQGEWKVFKIAPEISIEIQAAIADLQDSVSLLKTDETLSDVFAGTATVALDKLFAVDIDGRPSYKKPGATVYGPNGSQGIISAIDNENATVITTVAPILTTTSDVGMRGDYCSTYAVVDAPNGKPRISTGNTIVIPAGLRLDVPGTVAEPTNSLITLASETTHTATKTNDFYLAYVHGLDYYLECDQVCFMPSEPKDTPTTTCQLWYNGTEWKFRDINAGYVWTSCRAHILGKCMFTNGNLTRISYVGWYDL